ncbi:hypothetical protein GPL15_16025 [Clostridium sp. MCC353]|uniref:hypothetical protein n=1 Tax=Clostridium sp. MCC353 TaxID=2592646 RepID=UPI001C02F74A|nr:hypothetical protein [Clostridium sp. MCC353]MBT9778008.1 hypothetical protein [Clostridium sp. MCC353]
MDNLAIHFLNDDEQPVTQEAVSKLIFNIRNNQIADAFLALDEYGEEDSQEDAPVNIGRQTPVLKRNALDNLDLAAECVLHFAETGELYPNLKWEEAE